MSKNTKENPLCPRTVPKFQDISGQTHDTKLQCLAANKKYALRAIVQGDATLGRNGSFTPNEIVAVLDRNASVIAKTVADFDRAINRCRVNEKATPAVS